MERELVQAIKDAAGFTAPLNDWEAIREAARIPPLSLPDEVNGFDDGFSHAPQYDGCSKHRWSNGKMKHPCCLAYRRCYAIGMMLTLQQPRFKVVVVEVELKKIIKTEFWMTQQGAQASANAWNNRHIGNRTFKASAHPIKAAAK